MSTNSGNTLKLLDKVSSSVKSATTYVMLKNPDPDFVKQAKYFSGKPRLRMSIPAMSGK